MIPNIRNREQLLNRIRRLPDDRINCIDELLTRLEKEAAKEFDILSFAGAWKDLEADLFSGFTENLIERRKKNKRRLDG